MKPTVAAGTCFNSLHPFPMPDMILRHRVGPWVDLDEKRLGRDAHISGQTVERLSLRSRPRVANEVSEEHMLRGRTIVPFRADPRARGHTLPFLLRHQKTEPVQFVLD